MMSSQSDRSIRISEISSSTTKEQLVITIQKTIALEPAKQKKKLFGFASSSTPLPTEPNVIVSLAPQFCTQFGTATFTSPKDKKKALQSKAGGCWICDDVFDGITVLHSGSKPDLDIIAVHGLNGNAMDTWTAIGDARPVMWLRDLLPHTQPFGNSRIMTFGYNSKWADKRCLSGLSEWSDDLLDRVCSVRTMEEVSIAVFRCFLSCSSCLAIAVICRHCDLLQIHRLRLPRT
jgi:hypothetical protein